MLENDAYQIAKRLSHDGWESCSKTEGGYEGSFVELELKCNKFYLNLTIDDRLETENDLKEWGEFHLVQRRPNEDGVDSAYDYTHLENHFQNPLAPTETEVQLFKLEHCDLTYPFEVAL